MYILNESWKGMDRVTPEWLKLQADALTRNDDHDLDRDGLAALLYEMSEQSYVSAESNATLIIEHLLLVLISPNNDSQKHWLREVDNFINLFRRSVGVKVKNKLGNTNIRNELRENWSDVYNEAVAEVLEKANNAWSFNKFYTDQIPKENPWTVEDFLTKSSGSLLNILASKN